MTHSCSDLQVDFRHDVIKGRNTVDIADARPRAISTQLCEIRVENDGRIAFLHIAESHQFRRRPETRPTTNHASGRGVAGRMRVKECKSRPIFEIKSEPDPLAAPDRGGHVV